MRFLRLTSFLLAFLTVLAFSQEQPTHSSVPLIVETKPTGASIEMDGVALGVSPIQTTLPGRGRHILRVQLSPYLELLDEFNLDAETKPLTKSYHLRLPASIRLTSEPQGVSVFIDDSLRGTTPFLLEGVYPGSHRLRMELNDFLVWRRTVLVPDSVRVEDSVSFTGRYGYLTVETQSPDDQILVNNELIGTGMSRRIHVPYGLAHVTVVNVATRALASADFAFLPTEELTVKSRLNDPTLMPTVYSALIPGLGQFLHGSPTEGLTYLAIGLYSLGLAIDAHASLNRKNDSYQELHQKYIDGYSTLPYLEYRQIGDEMKAEYDDAKKFQAKRNLFVGLTALVWCGSAIEAYLNHREVSDIRQLKRARPDISNFSLSSGRETLTATLSIPINRPTSK